MVSLVRRKSRRFPANVVTDLMFADDIALLAEEINKAQEGTIHNVEVEAESREENN